MLNRIVWNWTVLTFKLRILLDWIVWNRAAFWYSNSVVMLNWIFSNRTVYMKKNGFDIE